MPAIAVPLQSDQVESWKAWAGEATGSRSTEFDDFNHRMGLTSHRVWLAESPQGTQVIVLIEGPGADTYLRILSASEHPFDVWFREKISEFHGIDFSVEQPGPPPQNMINWNAESLMPS